MMTRLNFDYNLLQNKGNFDNYSHGEQRLYCVDNPRGPLTNFNDGGGATEVHIFYPKRSQLQNLSTQKNHYFF